MKSLINYIKESHSTAPSFVDNFLKSLKHAGVKIEISISGDRDEVYISNDGVSLMWKNNMSYGSIPRTLRPSSGFDNEPVYITIIDNFNKNKKLKGLFDELMANRLKEATDGKTAQWGTWKFAVRNDIDVQIIMDALKNNNLI